MATAAIQLNTRIDRTLKQGGDAVFARCGLKASDVVRAVWKYAADHQVPPDCVLDDKREGCDEAARKLKLAEEGCGLAARMAAGRFGHDVAVLPDERPWSEVRDEMYDDVLDEMDRRCR